MTTDGQRTGGSGESPLIGAIIADRYRIISRVGAGGMGQVFLAEHIKMKRKSAIKVMRPALVDDADALQRFTREAENASKLSHPNVASIFDFGETTDGLVYLAMEFIEGESLHAALEREKALHPQVAGDIINQAADALQAAHDLGILHRDLKPDNLMLTTRADGTYLVKLVDFGIARTMDAGTTRVTRTGFAVGTPEFMSPEQLAGDQLDARSDQYALALVAFIALTGQEAFADASGKDSLILRLTSRPRRLAEVRTDIDWPVAIQSVFDRALAPDAADRFPRVADFADALDNAIASMSATQTAELYSRALQGRGIGAARRTPSIAHPTTARVAEKTRTPPLPSKAVHEAPAAKPIGMEGGRRGRVVPTVLVLSLFVYGLYWYGAQQPRGRARQLSDRIGQTTRTVLAPVMPYIDKMRSAATVAPPVPAEPIRRATKRGATSDTLASVRPVRDSQPVAGSGIDATARGDSGTADSARRLPPDTSAFAPRR
ncbi:MAG: serine/threonine protein kinase [Gemmatimonadaceae bacterium]|nr:serine/threonine protein kinase [Gemmatimonadaceae bacterium]